MSEDAKHRLETAVVWIFLALAVAGVLALTYGLHVGSLEGQRHLDRAQRTSLLAQLRRGTGDTLHISVVGGEAEVRVYALELAALFREAGWKVTGPASSSLTQVGVLIIAGGNCHPQEGSATRIAFRTLKDAGIAEDGCIADYGSDPSTAAMLIGFNPTSSRGQDLSEQLKGEAAATTE